MRSVSTFGDGKMPEGREDERCRGEPLLPKMVIVNERNLDGKGNEERPSASSVTSERVILDFPVELKLLN